MTRECCENKFKLGSLALIQFGVVVAKVFFYDLSFLQQFYRVLSFVVLGLALLLTSFSIPPAGVIE